MTVRIVKEGVLYGRTDKGNGTFSIETGVWGSESSTVLFLRIKNQEDFLPEDFATGLEPLRNPKSPWALGVANTLQTKWVNTNFHEGNPLLTFISTLWTFCSQYAYADWQQGKSHLH